MTTRMYACEWFDSHQGTRTMDVPANSIDEANEIFIRCMKRIPTAIYLIA